MGGIVYSTKDNSQLLYNSQICKRNYFICLDIYPMESSYFYTIYIRSPLNLTATDWNLRRMESLSADSTSLKAKAVFRNVSIKETNFVIQIHFHSPMLHLSTKFHGNLFGSSFVSTHSDACDLGWFQESLS